MQQETRANDAPLPRRPLRGVVFDMDGLMFNTEAIYQEVGRIVLARYGKDFPAELIDRIMGLKTELAFQVMIDWHELDIAVEELATETYRCFHDLLPQRLQTMPGLLPLLDALDEAQIPKAIATSSRRQTVGAVLSRFDLGQRFVAVITSEDVEHGKPAPEVYERAAASLDCVPAETLALEDSQLGCQAAVAAGAYTVAVPSGHSVRHSFPGAQFIAASLSDDRIVAALGLASA